MKNKNVTQQQTSTTELQAPDLGQAHTECGGVRLSLLEPNPNPGQWF